MSTHTPGMRPQHSLLNMDIDLHEHGADDQVLNERLFMQLLIFECHTPKARDIHLKTLHDTLVELKTEHVLYEDFQNPSRIGLLRFHTSTDIMHQQLAQLSSTGTLDELVQCPELNMTGRTYSVGYEHNLEDWIIDRPKRNVCDSEWSWAVWYPLRRAGSFEHLDEQTQKNILREHAIIGRAYGQQGAAHDVRLACHGLDTHDNDFVIGLIGKELHPLSHVVQRMRKTKQTSTYLESLGPFFIAKARYQHHLAKSAE